MMEYYMDSSGIRAEMEIARLTEICRKTDCGPLANEIVRLRAQIRAPLEEGNGAQIKALEAEKADLQAEKPDQAAKHDEDYKGIWGLYNEGLDANMQQYQQIAAMKAGNSEAGSGDEMSEEEQADQQAEQFATA
jgi:hypothetical protein